MGENYKKEYHYYNVHAYFVDLNNAIIFYINFKARKVFRIQEAFIRVCTVCLDKINIRERNTCFCDASVYTMDNPDFIVALWKIPLVFL